MIGAKNALLSCQRTSIGVERFELSVSRPQTERDTRLRYTPYTSMVETLLLRQDSNPDYVDQNHTCYQLHHRAKTKNPATSKLRLQGLRNYKMTPRSVEPCWFLTSMSSLHCGCRMTHFVSLSKAAKSISTALAG